jgi:hypothetical protein
MQFPGKDRIQDPLLDLCYEIEIEAKPQAIWPWIKQMGYHHGGWHIDTWWDKVIQEHFWPRLVPKDARRIYKPPANEILPEYQELRIGDIVPDGPPGSAYYEVIDLREEKLLLLYATSHFKYVAPQFVYKTRFAPKGCFCWAFILKELHFTRSKFISWWQAEIQPKKFFFFVKPFFMFVDGVHQREILRGIKRRVENSVC